MSLTSSFATEENEAVVAATGRRPIRFLVTGLPEGLQVDGGTGRISGSVTPLRADEVKQRGSARPPRGTGESGDG